MIYAKSPTGEKIGATPGGVGFCPICHEGLRAKCGNTNAHHWAHIAREDCDPWAEPDTAWHLNWQESVPLERREVVIGPHRADMVTPTGTVVELQNSSISTEEIREREQFYGDMVWIFNTIEAYQENRLNLRQKNGYWSFRWKQPRRTIAACQKPVLLDLGYKTLFRINRIHIEAPCGGWGKYVNTSEFMDWIGA